MSFKLLKKLTLLSLIVLLLPFFQTCSDKELMKNSLLKNSPLSEVVKTKSIHQDSVLVIIDSDSNTKEFQYTFNELKKKKQETVNRFLSLRDEATMNGYQLGIQFVQNLESNNFLDSINVLDLPFFLILIITCLLIYFSFKKKTKALLILSVLNLLLLVGYLLMYFSTGFFEDINQVKFGYYLFVINSILIIIESYKIRNIKHFL
ncbi:hypothetical protein [Flavobacterium pectinovorum]|uniref:hypothetical protein n=1 Tax=Flavobacterium pectinovorum TaxID=29533 RepID=UPI001FACFD13|nr:hypothetical protein [Flavobacterium pectinovorum]MCI9844735.1 hypothetical protein [Flavobacterium pectinovorum]